MSQSLHVAVFGAAGSIGRRHVDTCLTRECHVSAIDIDRDRLQAWHAMLSCEERERVSLHSSSVSLEHIDAAIIATPASQHLKHLRWCHETVTPAYCEKPLATMGELDQAIALATAFDSSKQIGRIGYNWRWRHDVIDTVARTVGKPPRWLRVSCFSDMAKWPGAAGKGEFVPEFSHALDLVLLFDDKAMLGSAQWHTPQHVVIAGIMSNGVWEVQLVDGVAPFKGITMIDHSGASVHVEWHDDPIVVRGSESCSISEFLLAARDGSSVRSSLSHGARMLAWCHEVMEHKPKQEVVG